MKKLNTLELAILNRLADKYPSVKLHIPFLQVKTRENTGVGMYVNFSYSGSPVDLKTIEPSMGAISTNDNIEIKGLKFGLGYEVDITDSKINFIEIITYGEEWDGDATDFRIQTSQA